MKNKLQTSTTEVNIDCLAGPTHHFGGLSFGNIASVQHKGVLSHPKRAALQGLEKMKLLSDLGVLQIVLPPHPRPHFEMLKRLGFEGSNQEIIEAAYKENPDLLLKCSSSSAMWAANSATVTPSVDSLDHKVHITCANLATNFHRSIEANYTEFLFRKIFYDPNFFTHHKMLPATPEFFDEGAANHTRFCRSQSEKGVHFFVYGLQDKLQPEKYPARQTKESQTSIAKLHKIDQKQLVFAQQNPKAIDAGVFHNDVISTGFQDIFLYHEEAFVQTDHVIRDLQEKCELQLIKITKGMLSVEDAVRSYLFNSQIVETKDKKIVLIAPSECEKIGTAKTCLEAIQKNSALHDVIFVPLQESMFNGGGPACLRLRMPLTQNEMQSIHQGVVFTGNLYNKLKVWIEKHYPDEFKLKMLLDHKFLKSIDEAFTTCLDILELGGG
jgi:succinylarginine dihydrolase